MPAQHRPGHATRRGEPPKGHRTIIGRGRQHVAVGRERQDGGLFRLPGRRGGTCSTAEVRNIEHGNSAGRFQRQPLAVGREADLRDLPILEQGGRDAALRHIPDLHETIPGAHQNPPAAGEEACARLVAPLRLDLPDDDRRRIAAKLPHAGLLFIGRRKPLSVRRECAGRDEHAVGQRSHEFAVDGVP
jgi:hypothetical protein